MRYYDIAVGACLDFKYTGCGGNNNRFRTEEDCKARCIPQPRRRPAPFLRRSETPVEAEPVEVVTKFEIVEAPPPLTIGQFFILIEVTWLHSSFAYGKS